MTRQRGEALAETLERLTKAGWPEAEVYAKVGRSRQLTLDGGRTASIVRRESGWAVRAGDDRRSFSYAATGEPRADTAWPEADGAGLRLPSPRPVRRWSPPADLDSPLVGENDAIALVRGIERALDTEMPGARLVRAILDDGSSESQLLSSRSVAARVRQRTAALHLEARLLGPSKDASATGATSPPAPATLVAAAREARQLNPVALARRLADRLMVSVRGASDVRDRAEILLAPHAAARLLAALVPMWTGPDAAAIVDPHGRLGGKALTLIDNGRMPGGLLEAPVDGEGIPTRGVRLVAEGIVQQPLLAWWQTPRQPGLASGCSLRASWRELPRPGPTHFFLAPSTETSAADLVSDIARGYYLLDARGTPRIWPGRDRFSMPTFGFALERGQAVGAVSAAVLTGSIRALLRGILQTARDLTFLPIEGGMIGAPTVLVRGLELDRATPPVPDPRSPTLKP